MLLSQGEVTKVTCLADAKGHHCMHVAAVTPYSGLSFGGLGCQQSGYVARATFLPDMCTFLTSCVGKWYHSEYWLSAA